MNTSGLIVALLPSWVATLPTPVAESAVSAAVLWKLNDLLSRKPLPISQIVEEIIDAVPERHGAEPKCPRCLSPDIDGIRQKLAEPENDWKVVILLAAHLADEKAVICKLES